MAVMWPRALPDEVKRNELRAAERKVYERLASELDRSWVVFYSRPWLGLKPSGEEIDGECDFVIARADSGILAIEIKGGAVSFDPATTQWMSRDRWGLRHKIKNPVAQARTSKHQLLEKVKNSRAWKSRRIRARHAVILPDSLRPGSELGPDMPLSLFCFLDEFEKGLEPWLKTRLGTPSAVDGEEPLGRDGLAALEELLVKPFALRTPVGHLVAEDDAALQALTPGQYRILTCLEEIPRAAVSGGAGTGKTLLAMEKARRCAETGMQTLLTCFNRPLADHLSTVLGPDSGVEVMTFHALCKRKAEAAGLSVPDGTIPDVIDERWPELLMQAAERRHELRYDAIVVDEGQDFRPHWWPAVDSLLTRSGRAQLYVFLDGNQRVYKETAGLPKDVGLIPIRLAENLRNTKRIHETAWRHYAGHATEAIGPEGVAVDWREVPLGGMRQALDACIARYVGQENIPAEDIAVLFAREQELRELVPGNRLGGCATVTCGPLRRGALTVDTVRRFKGLERPVVIVMADPNLLRDKELAYVALSRARSYLIVIGPKDCLARIREPE
ncbi:AAA family ATPase [Corallococcus silvisoli]|uniref:AAA family ATPase n=1 Tax=Corallococcus silvisoli TaxID=2697031 RepID=UPI001376CEEC|nr:AAA family ATPase [Corallococcus silvisoli]NBD14036.1 AAA family ATPase [Corallococcus silvisoli]